MSEQVKICDAKTGAVPQRGVKRKPGRMRGRVRIGRDFDAPLPGELFSCATP